MTTERGELFAKWTFGLAAAYGLITLVPSYGGLAQVSPGASPDAALFFYAFLSLAIAFQVLFGIIATNVRRYRMAMIPAMLDKLAFGIPVLLMRDISEAAHFFVPFGLIDLLLFVLFVAAFIATPRFEAEPAPRAIQ